MKCTRSRLLAALLSAVFMSLSIDAQTCLAQQGPTVTPVRTVLALTSLPTLVDAPLFFKLAKVQLPINKSTNYIGPVGFIYVLSGSMFAQTDVGRHSLREGDALVLDAGKFNSLTAAGSEPAIFLHFVLARAIELDHAAAREPAIVTELYRTAGPISHLKAGPYEFTLTRVTFPPRIALNAPHYRSGAALYYILSGPGLFRADEKSEQKVTGTPHFEPYGWVHQWANDAGTPLVLLQANISEEGVPAVIFGQAPLAPGR
jgi:quercetin dioxygenase-like cupin family protein